MFGKCRNKTLINISCNLFSSLTVKINLRKLTSRKRYFKSKNSVLWVVFLTFLFCSRVHNLHILHFVGQPARGRGERFSRKKIRFAQPVRKLVRKSFLSSALLPG